VYSSAQKRFASKQLNAFIKPARFWIAACVFVALLSNGCLIVQWYCVAHIIDAVYLHNASRQSLIPYFYALGIALFFRAFFYAFKNKLSFKTSERVRSAIRKSILKTLTDKGSFFLSERPLSEWLNATLEQVDELHDFCLYYLPQMQLSLLVPLVLLVIIFKLSVGCGILLLCCLPLIPLFMILVGMGAASTHQKYFQSLERLSHRFLDYVQGLATLKLFAQKKADSLYQASESYRIDTMKVLKMAFLSSAVLDVFSALSIALVAVYLGLGFINQGTGDAGLWSLHGLTLQDALFILLLIPDIFLPLRELGTHYHARAKAIAAILSIEAKLSLGDFINKPHLSPCGRGLPCKGRVRGNEINLKNVSFERILNQRTGEKKTVLKNMSLTITPKEKIAIVGESGSGKTTLLSLLLGFMMPTQGTITIGDTLLDDSTKAAWQEKISFLSQDIKTLPGTLRDNLMIANPTASDETLKEALRFAGLDSWQDNLAMPIGEQKLGLSGGQLQRLGLAKLFLKPAEVLILDEPTAHLDKAYEAKIVEALTHFWKDKTVIIATHHSALLEGANRIIKLHAGEIQV
jgi:ATP-binding cassette subfamily C protein CydD